MTVILLFLIFVAIGYLFAFTNLGDQIEEIGSGAVDKAKATVRRTGAPAAGEQIESASPVGEWVKRSTAVPDEFRGWYLSLAQSEGQRFEKALASHAQETQLRFSLLFNGELDRQPERRKVYVEAVSVYSQAYRKAREALEKDEELSGESLEPGEDGNQTVEGKVVAEKSVSRRHRDSGEFAPAG